MHTLRRRGMHQKEFLKQEDYASFAVGWRFQRRAAAPSAYAVTAPDGIFLVIVLTICGAATMWFALRSVWPAMRRIPGWQAWAWPARCTAILAFALIIADAQFGGTAPLVGSGLSGLFELACGYYGL